MDNNTGTVLKDTPYQFADFSFVHIGIIENEVIEKMGAPPFSRIGITINRIQIDG